MDDEEWERIADLGAEANTDREWFEMATAELRGEIEDLRALVRHMDRCVQRGGPRNYVEFLHEPLASAHATACTEG